MHDDIIILLRIGCFNNSAFEVALSSVTTRNLAFCDTYSATLGSKMSQSAINNALFYNDLLKILLIDSLINNALVWVFLTCFCLFVQ